MVVGIGGIGNIRDPGDPNDPRRGTSVPQQTPITGLPAGEMTGGFDFDAWDRRQKGLPPKPEPAPSAFDQLAEQFEAQRAAASGQDDGPLRRMPSGVSRAQFQAKVDSLEERQNMVTRLQAAQSPREQANILGEFTGMEMSDGVASTASRLLTDADLGFDAPTAVLAAQNQENRVLRTPGTRQSRPGLQAAIERISNAAALEPADKPLNRELRGGSEEIDFDNPATERARTSYEQLQDQAESEFLRAQNAISDLGRDERRQANAESGAGRRINGRANPLDKEKFERMEAFQVPVIMADQRVNARGELAAPQITTGFRNRKPTTLLDAAQARLALLNPAAELPLQFAQNFGYTRPRSKDKSETNAYDKTPDVPTTDPSSFVVDEDGTKRYGGFAPYDDPAYLSGPVGNRDVNAGAPRYVTNAPMTLGQAVDFVMNSHKTPVKTYTDDMVNQIAGDRYVRNEDGSNGARLFALKNQRDEDLAGGMTAYRVGTPKMFDDGFEPELVQLLRGASGGSFITDQAQSVGENAQTRMVGGERLLVGEKIGFYDQEIRDQQARLLLDSFDDRMLGSYAADLPADSKKSLMAIATLLAKGRNLPVDQGAPVVSAYPQGTTEFSGAAAAAADQQRLQKLGEARQATARKNRVKQKFSAENRTPLPASAEVQAAIDLERELNQASALLKRDYEQQQVRERLTAEAAAASEQNSRQPQTVSEGVMNTDQTSQLNAPAPPVMSDEPTPRAKQMAASAPSQATNAVNNDRVSQMLAGFMRRVRNNPLKSAAAAGGGALAALGASPYDPREGE